MTGLETLRDRMIETGDIAGLPLVEAALAVAAAMGEKVALAGLVDVAATAAALSADADTRATVMEAVAAGAETVLTAHNAARRGVGVVLVARPGWAGETAGRA